jgi:UDPglucose 6-dehydrogenase
MSFEIRKVCCIGAGYVGGPTMAVFANKCSNIQFKVVDINSERIQAWNSQDLSKIPIFEPGLEKLISKCRGNNLFFTTDIKSSICEADMIFLSVNTPTKTKGIGAGKASDLKWVEASARQIAEFSSSHTIVVEKSTLPVRTAETIKKILESSQNHNPKLIKKSYSVLSNPEFLAEGNAINDLENPDRVLIGGDDDKAIKALENIYLNWISPEKIIKTNLWSSELSKLSANAFLAQRISSINSISAICEETGADIKQVSEAIGLDSRIGGKFLTPSPGFGGSCFQKDILNLIYLCEFYKLDSVAKYWQGVIDINKWQKTRISKLIINKLFGNVSGKKIAILGFAFKSNTNDIRNSPAIDICHDLLEEGSCLAIYDPKVEIEQIKNALKDKVDSLNNPDETNILNIYSTINDVFNDCDAVVILTEWEEFSHIDWRKYSKFMRKPSWVFDTRSCVNQNEVINAGINFWRIGSEPYQIL